VLVENPWTPNDWRVKDGWWRTPSYYWFSHFTKFVRPGMRRVTAGTQSRDLLVAGFSGPDGSFTAILLNRGRTAVAGVVLRGLPPGSPAPTVFRSTLAGGLDRLGALRDGTLDELPATSITTVTTHG
jgi:hypothetical protein